MGCELSPTHSTSEDKVRVFYAIKMKGCILQRNPSGNLDIHPSNVRLAIWTNSVKQVSRSPCEGEQWEGKHRQQDQTKLFSEHLSLKHIDLELEISSVEVCGLEE